MSNKLLHQKAARRKRKEHSQHSEDTRKGRCAQMKKKATNGSPLRESYPERRPCGDQGRDRAVVVKSKLVVPAHFPSEDGYASSNFLCGNTGDSVSRITFREDFRIAGYSESRTPDIGCEMFSGLQAFFGISI